MQYSILSIVAVSLLASQAAGKTITVDVGKNGLKFNPESVTAEKGDVIQFNFDGKHSVATSSFDQPCEPLDGANTFYSGMKSSGSFSVTVNTTDPTFIYCSKGNHCKKGMVGVINPSQDKTLDGYKSNAKNAGNGKSPDSVFGGSDGDGKSSDDKKSGAGSLATPLVSALAVMGAIVAVLA